MMQIQFCKRARKLLFIFLNNMSIGLIIILLNKITSIHNFNLPDIYFECSELV